MRSVILGAAVVLWGAAPALGQSSKDSNTAKKRPNVIFILADDLGYGDLGCYGHKTIKTPVLDKLAAQGMRFTQFYVTAPVCTPSRASFMTGRHAQRFNIHHADLPETKPRYPLPLDAITLSRLLQMAGYITAHFGKWHLGEPPLTGMPRKHGFDHFFGSMGGRPSSSWNKFARYEDGQYFLNENPAKTYPGFNTDVVTDHVLKHLDDIGKKDQPFYINLWYNAPHEPLSPKVKEAELYPGLDKKKQTYFGTVTNMDRNIGRILKKLEDLGIAENTIIIFSSDNGPEVHNALSAGSAGILRGMKTQLWEGGVRVPFIVRWPGHVPAGKTSDAVASGLDFLPTICEAAGVKYPNPKILDEGMNILPVLLGKQEGKARTLYWEFHGSQRGGPASGTLAMRHEDWKLHLYSKENKRALYNLKDDPGESKDVSGQKVELTNRLERQLLLWYENLPHENAKRQKMPLPKTEEEANRLPLKN